MSDAIAELTSQVDELSVSFGGDFWQRLLEIASKAIAENIGQAEALRDKAMELYWSKIAPIDMPWVPNIIEPSADRLMGLALEKILNHIIATLKPGQA